MEEKKPFVCQKFPLGASKTESKVDGNDEVSDEDQQLNRFWSDLKSRPATPTFGEMVTILVTVLSNLSKSLNLANEMLHNERQITQNLWKGIQDLKLKLEDHKDTTTRNTVKPLETPSSIVIEESVIGNNGNNKRTFVHNRSKRQRAKPNNNRNSGLGNAKSNKKASSALRVLYGDYDSSFDQLLARATLGTRLSQKRN